jgi:hypothetical protein
VLKKFHTPEIKEKCPNCGQECSEADVLCPNCGKNLNELFEQLPESGISAPPLFGGITSISIKVFAVFHAFVFVYFSRSLFSPYNGWIIGDKAKAELLAGMLLICLSGILFAYSFFLFMVKYSKDSWQAGIPIAISTSTWVLTLFILPFFANFFDLPFRIHQKEFEESAVIMANIQRKTEAALPSKYSDISVTGGVYLVEGRVFYMQSIGMMAEYGPGYLYDPSKKPEEVCIRFSRVFFTTNWYDCNLNWNLLW